MSIQKIIRCIVGLGLVMIPLWFLPFTTDIVEFNKQILLVALAIVGLLLFLVDMIKNGVLRYTSHPFYWPLFGMIIAGVVSLAVSVNRYGSLFGSGENRSFALVSLVALTIFFFLAVNTMRGYEKIMRTLLLGSMSLTLIFATLQMIGLSIFSVSPFSNPSFNAIGSLTGVGLLVAALLPFFLIASPFTVRWQKIFYNIVRYVAIVCTLFILVVLNAPLVWIIAGISMLGYVAFAYSGIDKKQRVVFFIFPMVVIVLGVLLWLSSFTWESLQSKYALEVLPSTSTSYDVALSSIASKPLGYGLENYIFGYEKIRPISSVNNVLFQARFTDGSSQLTTMIVEGGVPLLLAFLGFVGIFILVLFRQFTNGFGGDVDGGKLWASAVALVAIFFLYPVSLVTMFATLMVVALASTIRGGNTAEEKVFNLEDRSVYSLVASIGFIAGLVFALTVGYFLWNQYRANVALAQSIMTENTEVSIDALVKSINIYSEDSRAYRRLSLELLKQVAEDIKSGQGDLNTAEFNTRLENRIASAINVAVRATEADPADSENWMNRGFIYQNFVSLVAGADAEALKMYEEALQRNPGNALAHARIGNMHLALADIAIRAGDRQKANAELPLAEEAYKRSIALYNNYGQALYNLAAVYDRKGELGSAIEQFEKIEANAPRDPSVLFQIGLLYYRNNQKDDALRSWERAVLAFPKYSNAHWYLSLIYEERGNIDGAIKELKIIQELNPDNQLVKDRLAQLEAGQRTIVPPEDVLDQEPLNNEQ